MLSTPERSFKPPVHDCGTTAVRFNKQWICPSCQEVGPTRRPFGEVFTSRALRRGRVR